MINNPDIKVTTNTSVNSFGDQRPVALNGDIRSTVLVETGIQYAAQNVIAGIAGAAAAGAIDSGAYLSTNALGISVGGFNVGKIEISGQVDCIFELSNGQTVSFDYMIDQTIQGKDTNGSVAEYNRAYAESAIYVLDITNSASQPTMLAYMGIDGKLVSTENTPDALISNLTTSGGGILTNINTSETPALINGVDVLTSSITGTYSYTATGNTQLAVVKVNISDVLFGTDPSLEEYKNQGYKVGTFENDHLTGTRRADKIYGGWGDDKLKGKGKNDILVGGHGDDTLIGGNGKDTLTGGAGADSFHFAEEGNPDTITDFNPAEGDKIVLKQNSAMFASLNTFVNGVLPPDKFTNFEFNSTTGAVSYNAKTFVFLQGISVLEASYFHVA